MTDQPTTEPTAESLAAYGFDLGYRLGRSEGKLDAFLAQFGPRPDTDTTTTKENTMTTPATGFAHPIDEPCPDGCPTRLDEITSYVTEHHGASVTVTADDVRAALAAPPETRDDVQRQVAEIAATWV